MHLLVAGQDGVEHDLAAWPRRRAAAPMASPSKTVPSASTSSASRTWSPLIAAPRRRPRPARPASTVWRTRPVQRAPGVGRVAAPAGQPAPGRPPTSAAGSMTQRLAGRPASIGPPWLSAMPAMAAGCHDISASTSLDRQVELGERQRQRRLEARACPAAPRRTAAPWRRGVGGVVGGDGVDGAVGQPGLAPRRRRRRCAAAGSP